MIYKGPFLLLHVDLKLNKRTRVSDVGVVGGGDEDANGLWSCENGS